jgi:hypothetical protein
VSRVPDDDPDDDGAPELVEAPPRARELAADPELPVVARLVIEIHSDGTRTIARGALVHTDDSPAGASQVAIEARGGSPLALAMQLTRQLATSIAPLALQRRAVPRAQPTPPPRTGLRAELRSRVRGLLRGKPSR